MKRLALILGAGALLLAMPLAACTSAQVADAATNLTTTSAAQAHTLAAAENAYTAAAQAAKLYVQTAKPSKDVLTKLAGLDQDTYAALVTARKANAAGNSPAVAAALEVFNAKYGSFFGFLRSLGVPVPD